MDSCCYENLPSNRKKAIDELLRGQENAKLLGVIMNKSIGVDDDDGSITAENLVKDIMNSFNNTLSILNGGGDHEVVSRIPAATTQVGSPCWDGRNKSSEDSGESSKSTSAAVKLKDRRGCYKRRKSSHSWTKEDSTLTDDGHAWRKYGQKVILNAKYPRNYFRCTHKFDQHCQATKQVQRTHEQPPLYRTTYYGHHTCQNLLKASSQFVLDTIDHHHHTDSSTLISFNNNSNHLTNKQNYPFLIPPSVQSVKQEYYSTLEDDDDILKSYDPTTYNNININNDNSNNNNNNNNNQASSSDHYLFSPDDDDRGHMSTFDHGDVISGVNSSCTTSTSHSLDMDSIMVGSVDFHDDDVLGFEF